MSTTEVKRVNTTRDEFVKQKKRDILKAVKTSPKYSRSSAAAKVAFAETDSAIALNRTESPACTKGCSFCCYLQTDITAGESFVLAAAVRRMPDERRHDVMTRLRSNAQAFAAMSLTERQRAKIPCALLDLEKGSCSVYEGRPTACRRWHSLDAKRCEIEFNDPASTGTPADPVSMTVSSLVGVAYVEAMKEPLGELHQGVLMAIDPDAEKRFAKGDALFRGWTLSVTNATDEEEETFRQQTLNLADAFAIRNHMPTP